MTRQIEARDVARPPRAVQAEKLGLGVALIVVGALWTAQTLGWVRVSPMRVLWPLFVIAPGLARVLLPGRRRGGLLMVGLGAVFLAHTTGLFRMHQLWPLFLVLGGASMVMRAFEVRRESDAGRAPDDTGRRV